MEAPSSITATIRLPILMMSTPMTGPTTTSSEVILSEIVVTTLLVLHSILHFFFEFINQNYMY